MATQASIDLAQQLYVAYYGRPADPAGLAFWADAFDAAGDDLTDALAAFGSSSEFTNSFGSLDNTSLIENLYQQLFGHAADAGGLAFYLDRLDTGAATLASIAKQIADGALTTDLDALNNRITVANTFTSTIESTGASYNGAIDIASAQAILGAVDSTAASVTTGNAAATAQASPATFTVTTSGNEVAEGDILTVTVTASKTLGTDTAFSFGLQGDTLDGVIDAATTADYTSTSSGQILILAGQSSTSFDIDIADDSTAEAIEGLNVVILDGDLNVVGEANAIILDAPNLTTGTDDIEILRPDSADTVKGIFDGVGDTLTVGDVVTGNGLTTFNLTLGTTGLAPAVTMTGIDAIEVTATTNATLTIDASTWGSDISSVSLAGADAGTLIVNNADITGTLDVTVGASSSSYVNVTGDLDASMTFTASINNDDADGTAGSISLGVAGIDVVVGKSDNAYAGISQSAQASKSATADSVVGDFTIGNINSTGAGTGANADIYLSNSATVAGKGAPDVNASAGDLVLGDVTITHGKSGDGDFTVYNYVRNDAKGDGTAGDFTIGNVSHTLGSNASGYGYLYNSVGADTGDATVGDFLVGDITLDVGKGGDYSLSVTNTATVAISGDAVAGDVTIGNITLTIGTNASGSFSATNNADSGKGNATVGNTIVGDINLSVAKSGSNDWLGFYNSARADTGDATAGNISFGNITATQATSGDYAIYMGAYNTATVLATGDAIAGNITAGDITITAGDEIDWNGVELDNDARADKGDATVGDITVGDIVMNLGDGGDDSVSLDIENQASVATSGAATAGDISIGNITANAGSSNSFDISITQDVDTAKGAATMGNVSIGNLSSNLGLDADLLFNVDVSASGTAGDSIGDITIGNVDVYGQPDASLDFEIFASAANGSVGTYTLGDVNITLDGDGYLSFENTISAASSIAGVSIGDVNISLGASATLYYFTIGADAGTTLGDVSIGNITITGGLSVTDSDVAGISLTGNTGIGNVAVGDVTITAGKGGAFDSFSMNVAASAGAVGTVTLGNETLSGSVSRSIDVTGNSIGAVTIGDISVTASGTANGSRYADFTADTTSIGDVSIGDVTVAGTAGGSAKVSDFFSAATTVGAISAGDITLTASGVGGDAYYSLSATAGTSGGSITAGDISLSATASTVNAATSAIADLALVSGKGAVTVGDVTVAGSAAGTGSTPASASIAFSLNAATTVTVGDITVSGGGVDNLATLTSWMTTAGTTTTVGNVDYSGYTAAATIDVSALLGAGEIIASSGGSTITDNMTKNIITLGAGADTVNLDANDATTALMPLDTSDATAIDEIIGFTSGVDTLDIETTSGSDTFSFVSGPAADYAAFLAAAEAAMTNFGTDIYAREVDGDIYLAIDDDNVTASGARDIEFVVKLSGITSLDSGDVTIS